VLQSSSPPVKIISKSQSLQSTDVFFQKVNHLPDASTFPVADENVESTARSFSDLSSFSSSVGSFSSSFRSLKQRIRKSSFNPFPSPSKDMQSIEINLGKFAEVSTRKVASYSMIGLLNKNEDRDFSYFGTCSSEEPGNCTPKENRLENFESADALNVSCFAVIDGHGGHGCSDFLSKNLLIALEECSAFQEFGDEIPTNLMKGAKQVFRYLETKFESAASQIGDTSGACAVVAFIYQTYLCVANIGDCLAVFSDENAKLVHPSEVHRSSVATEESRVLQAGGYIDKGRICGTMVPSRAIGDLDVKVAYPGALIAEPHISLIELRPGKYPPFLILASDVIWDFLTTSEAARMVKKTLKKNNWNVQASNIAEKLANKAKRNGSRDDITVTVILF